MIATSRYLHDGSFHRWSVTLATRNQGKVQEFERLLEGAFTVQSLPAGVELPEETGETFAANARLKAQAVFAVLGGEVVIMADDSGLEVVALNGEPGIRSARYAGVGASDEENLQKLLLRLGERQDRAARFICALCVILPATRQYGGCRSRETGPCLIEVEGVVEGDISLCPRGSGGFGYDPVFVPQGWKKTLSEASAEEKDEVSHRGAAAKALLSRLCEEGVLDSGA